MVENGEKHAGNIHAGNIHAGNIHAGDNAFFIVIDFLYYTPYNIATINAFFFNKTPNYVSKLGKYGE